MGEEDRADNTGFIANQLTNTHSGYNWLSDYFHAVRINIVDGKWDDAEARRQLKDAVMRSRPQSLLGMEIREDTIDWERLYNECWEATKPEADWEKQELRKRLERRRIDPDEFGWDLTLTGEEYEWAFLKNRSTAQPNEEEVTSKREPEKKTPREVDDIELAITGIESGMKSIELTLQMMKAHLDRLQQMIAEQNREE